MLLFMDISMDGMTIKQVIIKIRGREEMKRCVVIKEDGLIVENVKGYHGQIVKGKTLVEYVLMKCFK